MAVKSKIPLPLPPIPPIVANPPTVLAFLNAFSIEQVDPVMAYFLNTSPNTIPRIGITSYGPQFIGYSAVQRLFRQLFSSFQNLKMTQQGPVDPQNPTKNWLFNSDASMIGIQVIFSGLQVGSWFAAGTPYYSPPLSNIVPDSNHTLDLDASVIFTMDNASSKIVQISIYFDRYLMSQQLATALH
jgi:hypothetical protein